MGCVPSAIARLCLIRRKQKSPFDITDITRARALFTDADADDDADERRRLQESRRRYQSPIFLKARSDALERGLKRD